MTTAQLRQQSPQDYTRNLIERVHARIASVNGWSYVFSQIPAFQDAVAKAPAQVPCPFGGQGKTKFRFRKKDLYTGSAIHQEYPPNQFVDGIDILSVFYNLSKAQTCKQILSEFFGDDIKAPLKESDIINLTKYNSEMKSACELSPEEVESRIAKLEAVYHFTNPVTPYCAVAKYLSNRGINRILTNFPADIGFNPKLYYWDADLKAGLRLPAMPTIFRCAKGRALTIHRTFLDGKGGKANVVNPKLMMKPPYDMSGGSAQLYEPHYDPMTKIWTLCVSEGIENALSVVEATSMPCWAACAAYFMEAMEIPDNVMPAPDVKGINFYIWADKDKANEKGNHAGLDAANKLKDRMTKLFSERYPASQLTIEVFEPALPIPQGKKGVDWNDVLMSQGSAGFPIVWAPETLAQLK